MRFAGWGWFVAGLFGAGCAKGPATVPGIATLEADWQPFRWVDLRIGGTMIDRAAIVVDALDSAMVIGRQQGGAPLAMQLDFGFAGTAAQGIPLRLVVPDTAPMVTGHLVGRLTRLGPREDSSATESRRVFGTLGLLYFGLRGLVIDQVGQRLGAPRGRGSLPPALAARMQWTEGAEEAGRFRLPLTAESTPVGDVVIDPASSLVPLLVEAALWRRITGRTGREADNMRLSLPTTGDSLILVGARPTVPLGLGAIPISPSAVYFAASGPADLVSPRLGRAVVGVIGNQLFRPYRLVYLNVRAKRFGVIR